MKTRTLFFIAVLIAALALGAGLILAQDNGGATMHRKRALWLRPSRRDGT